MKLTHGYPHGLARGNVLVWNGHRYRVTKVGSIMTMRVMYEWQWYNREFERVFLFLVGAASFIFVCILL